jgi:hypothetical protein
MHNTSTVRIPEAGNFPRERHLFSSAFCRSKNTDPGKGTLTASQPGEETERKTASHRREKAHGVALL